MSFVKGLPVVKSRPNAQVPKSVTSQCAAVCHYFQKNSIIGEKTYTGWKAFLADNPGRTKA